MCLCECEDKTNCAILYVKFEMYLNLPNKKYFVQSIVDNCSILFEISELGHDDPKRKKHTHTPRIPASQYRTFTAGYFILL